MTAADLNPNLRQLIDARLEAVDQALQHARIGWSERRAIIGEVETQIYELLSRRSAAEPTEDDVVVVLASLDPPEAYVPEGFTPVGAVESSGPLRDLPSSAIRMIRRCVPGAATIAILVIVNGAMIAIAIASEGVIPWLVTLGGLAWLNYEGLRRVRAWAATRDGSLFDNACRTMGAWLISKSSAPAA